MKNFCPYRLKNIVGQSLCDLSAEYGKYGIKVCQQIDCELCHKWLTRAIKEKHTDYQFIDVDGIKGAGE